MKDKFIWGGVFGMLANIPKEIVDFGLYLSGLSKFFCWMIPGGITLDAKWMKSFHGIVIGGINDFIIAGALGVGLTYFLTVMEKRYLFLKGIAYSLGTWLFLCMMVITRVSYWVKLKDPWFYYHNFSIHQIWGLVATWLIIKYLFRHEQKNGDNSENRVIPKRQYTPKKYFLTTALAKEHDGEIKSVRFRKPIKVK